VLFQLTGQGAAVTTVRVHGEMLFTGSSDGLVRQFCMEEGGVASEIMPSPSSKAGRASDPFGAFDINTLSPTKSKSPRASALNGSI